MTFGGIATIVPFVAALAVASLQPALGQFWRLNQLSDKDLFIVETRASMASGICYKEVPSQFNDPSLKFKTISYCCEGYARNPLSAAMSCAPLCAEDCSNGLCTAPDVCECFPGYERVAGRCEET